MSHRLRWFVLILAVAVIPSLTAQQPPAKTPAAPLPTPLLSAKKVFISNGGTDPMAWRAFDRAGTPDEPYNSFYAAMKDWGHYDLVNDPANADVIFLISFGAPLVDAGKVDSYAPHLHLSILDAKTHFTLWTTIQPVEGAFRKVTWEKNYAAGMAGLMGQLKKLTATTQAAGDGG